MLLIQSFLEEVSVWFGSFRVKTLIVESTSVYCLYDLGALESLIGLLKYSLGLNQNILYQNF